MGISQDILSQILDVALNIFALFIVVLNLSQQIQLLYSSQNVPFYLNHDYPVFVDLKAQMFSLVKLCNNISQ